MNAVPLRVAPGGSGGNGAGDPVNFDMSNPAFGPSKDALAPVSFKIVASSQRATIVGHPTNTGNFITNAAGYGPKTALVTRVSLVDVDIPDTQYLIERTWNRMYFDFGLLSVASCPSTLTVTLTEFVPVVVPGPATGSSAATDTIGCPPVGTCPSAQGSCGGSFGNSGINHTYVRGTSTRPVTTSLPIALPLAVNAVIDWSTDGEDYVELEFQHGLPQPILPMVQFWSWLAATVGGYLSIVGLSGLPAQGLLLTPQMCPTLITPLKLALHSKVLLECLDAVEGTQCGPYLVSSPLPSPACLAPLLTDCMAWYLRSSELCVAIQRDAWNVRFAYSASDDTFSIAVKSSDNTRGTTGHAGTSGSTPSFATSSGYTDSSTACGVFLAALPATAADYGQRSGSQWGNDPGSDFGVALPSDGNRNRRGARRAQLASCGGSERADAVPSLPMHCTLALSGTLATIMGFGSDVEFVAPGVHSLTYKASNMRRAGPAFAEIPLGNYFTSVGLCDAIRLAMNARIFPSFTFAVNGNVVMVPSFVAVSPAAVQAAVNDALQAAGFTTVACQWQYARVGIDGNRACACCGECAECRGISASACGGGAVAAGAYAWSGPSQASGWERGEGDADASSACDVGACETGCGLVFVSQVPVSLDWSSSLPTDAAIPQRLGWDRTFYGAQSFHVPPLPAWHLPSMSALMTPQDCTAVDVDDSCSMPRCQLDVQVLPHTQQLTLTSKPLPQVTATVAAVAAGCSTAAYSMHTSVPHGLQPGARLSLLRTAPSMDTAAALVVVTLSTVFQFDCACVTGDEVGTYSVGDTIQVSPMDTFPCNVYMQPQRYACVPPNILGFTARTFSSCTKSVSIVSSEELGGDSMLAFSAPRIVGAGPMDVRQDPYILLCLGFAASQGIPNAGEVYMPGITMATACGEVVVAADRLVYAKVLRSACAFRCDYERQFSVYFTGNGQNLSYIRVALLNADFSLYQTHGHAVSITLRCEARASNVAFGAPAMPLATTSYGGLPMGSGASEFGGPEFTELPRHGSMISMRPARSDMGGGMGNGSGIEASSGDSGSSTFGGGDKNHVGHVYAPSMGVAMGGIL
jgi:hypothetical protein